METRSPIPFSPLSSLWCSGIGADPSRPLCRKAKDLRKERRLQKEQKRQQEGRASALATPTQPSQAKALEDLISESLPDSPLHRLEV